VSDRPADRPVPPLARASARKRVYTDKGTNDGTSTERRATPRTGTLGGSNRMLSARDVAAILAIPERTVRDKWREWGLPAYKIGKHLRWRERDLYAWIDRQAA
jgi:excisionase family DNA binding protein